MRLLELPVGTFLPTPPRTVFVNPDYVAVVEHVIHHPNLGVRCDVRMWDGRAYEIEASADAVANALRCEDVMIVARAIT